MHDACLHDRLLPNRVHGLGQPLQPVTHHHEHVLNATVLDLGEHLQPVLSALTTIARPQAEDVSVALRGDSESNIDGPVRDLPITVSMPIEN